MRLSRLFAFGLLLVGCDNAESALCPAGLVRQADGCVPASVAIHLSSVGFVPGSAKQASYAGPAGTFVIRRVEHYDGSTPVPKPDDPAVFPDQPGDVGPAIAAPDSAEDEIHVIDFSELDAPGQYYVDLIGLGKSAPFRVGDDVFVDPFHAAMLGMYGWRCGMAVSFEWQGQAFGHGACHLDDGPASGGWHDAGDYGKYTNNGAFSLGVMLFAWDHFRDKLENIVLDVPERDNGVPDYLDECAYQLRWLLGMQLDDGSASDRITAATFDGLSTMPEASSLPRKMAPPSTKATADLAAVAAHAARIFREFDPDLADRAEQAAQRAWQFLKDNPVSLPATTVGFTGYYAGDPDSDDRLWAAAELFETTDDEDALAAFEQAPSKSVYSIWDWDNVANLGVFAYLDSAREDRDPDVVDSLTKATIATGKSLATAAAAHAYGRSLGTYYNWGVNGAIARTTLTLVMAARLDPDNARTYTDAASEQLAHLFGRNYYGRSFVTGVGLDPPTSPHHRPSVGDGIAPPWPGLLVGGAMGGDPAPATTWVDHSDDYTSNEVAINWNSALIYALAAFLPEP